MRFNYIAKCGKCGNRREVTGFQEKNKKIQSHQASIYLCQMSKVREENQT